MEGISDREQLLLRMHLGRWIHDLPARLIDSEQRAHLELNLGH